MSNPFSTVECTVRYDNARVITWAFIHGLDCPGEFSLQIENSRAGGPWEILDDDLTACCSYVDNRKRNYNKRLDECYRLRLTIKDTGEEWVSGIVNAGDYKAYPFSAAAENVITQAVRAIEVSGCSGVLLKKKHWGPKCPICVDFDDQQTVNEHCPRCLGTGIDGGYYSGISMSIIKDAIQRVERQGKDSIDDIEVVQARCIAYPWVRYGDVWCEDGTNKRYIITETTPTASYKQTHLIYTIKMSLIEYTDVLHSSIADDKVNIKDLYDSSEVNYTVGVMSDMEHASGAMWLGELDRL